MSLREIQRSISWMQIIDACGSVSKAYNRAWSNTTLSVNIAIRPCFDARGCRDWLYRADYPIIYEKMGMHLLGMGKLPLAVRFTFQTVDDRMLFALRWL